MRIGARGYQKKKKPDDWLTRGNGSFILMETVCAVGNKRTKDEEVLTNKLYQSRAG